MNRGAFVYSGNFLSETEIADAAQHADRLSASRTTVHSGGKYADLRWFQVPLDKEWPIAAKMLRELDVETPAMLVFYYLEPGAVLHPHRDLTGASTNDRIRFHIPIVTNPGVEFVVNGERIFMAPGDLWCLDTSYLHAVRNDGDATRVHMIVECDISPTVRKRLPGGIMASLHSLYFISILGAKFVSSIVVNSIKDPAYFRAQMGMVSRFISWRFFGGTGK